MNAIAPPLNPTNPAGIGGTPHEFVWNWKQQAHTVVYETLGQGSPVLLLPAFSTVSTRSEMRGLAERLSTQFQVWAMDWLGFGESDRPSIDYRSPVYHQLLQDFVRSQFDTPVAVIAAGHAAGYVMQLASMQPAVWSKIVLVAPTWRGPLPTMGANQQVAGVVRETVRSPLLGQALYKLNTVPSFLNLMYRRHVYTNIEKLTPEFIQQKYRITQRPGARFAPAAFVTGTLDPAQNRDEFLQNFQSLSVPLMLVISEQAPPGSKAEMEVIAAQPNVQSQRLPGSLGLHEEYAAEVAAIALPFLTTN
ncbi:alpha/beta hydrolase [Cyanobacteria bacterium FACHB-471]|nr:alpha/beta hydrolase [Cyanobacteria bacterium FACHB-471]